MSAVGVLVGGLLTGCTSRHGLVTAVGLLCTATVCVLVGLIDFPALALIAADVERRLLHRPDHAVARHDRARGDAARAPMAGCSAS